MSAAAAVAEAASEALARVPPAIAATFSVLDPQPASPASCATDLGEYSQGSGREQLACYVDAFRSGAALEELLYVFNIRARLRKRCVGQAESGRQTADEADARQYSAERCRIVEP